MQLHPRHDATARAKIDIQQAVIAAAQTHELTYAELVGILAEILSGWTKSEIREERGAE